MFVARKRELVERRSFRTSNYARTDKNDRFKIKYFKNWTAQYKYCQKWQQIVQIDRST